MKFLVPMNGFRVFRAFLLVLLGSSFSYAQISQTQRYERSQKNSDDYFNIISLKENGLGLYREREKFRGGKQIWELILLDTALQERSTVELEIHDHYKMIGYEVTPGNIYFLYRTGETSKNDF